MGARAPAAYWAMDLNPDQLIALRKIKPTSFTAKCLEAVNRFILARANLIVTLDRFMAARLAARGVSAGKIQIMPPWPHEEHIQNQSTENPFRERHGLGGQFVIMYSGNHSPSNPLATILKAAVELKGDPSLRFVFVGGGHGKKEVERTIVEHALRNTLSLPYQPISELKYSLTAADVHVVSLGEEMVGIIHPCKIYGAMSAGKPILFLGPKPSHISDLLEQHAIGLQVSHGDVAGTLEVIDQFRKMSTDQRLKMGDTARAVLNRSLSQSILCGQFCDALEQAMQLKP